MEWKRMLCLKLRNRPKLKFRFRAIKLKISNLGSAILLPQFKIGANLKLRTAMPQVNHSPQFKIETKLDLGYMVPQVNHSPQFKIEANWNSGNMVSQVNNCSNLKWANWDYH